MILPCLMVRHFARRYSCELCPIQRGVAIAAAPLCCNPQPKAGGLNSGSITSSYKDFLAIANVEATLAWNASKWASINGIINSRGRSAIFSDRGDVCRIAIKR